ncbi:YhdP family protein [Thiosulfativibrio zosterae]|uniref:YhdP central domain-containing protein n=1 Tax=Thiosulfativibrio zosterae TaxID=2675053 RepID=A0A6F8PQ09_9GAMM|nr:AsmA-like C-terminal region-containing protein [Thiosulfativibrio zosterae]BBP44080.1 hypothetical protein THMIRHAT_18260 [Thiosulfativibrio zosterae]
MFKRLQQFSLILLILLLAYFATLTAAIFWLQVAPKQLVWVAEKLSSSEISFKDLQLTQTWQGMDVEIHQLQVVSANTQVRAQVIKFDFNFWSPFFYSLDPGQSLSIEGLRLETVLQQPAQNNDFLMNPQSVLSDFHVRNLWQKIQLKNIEVNLAAAQYLKLHIDEFQSYKGLHWRTLGQFSVALDEMPSVNLQFKSDFETTLLSHLSAGEFDVSMSSPLDLALWHEYLPEQWQSLLPNGIATAQLNATLKNDGNLTLTTDFNAQQLAWTEHDDLMPKSMGVQFQFSPSINQKLSWAENWQFKLESLRLDNEFVEAHSPITVSLGHGNLLGFESQSISLKPFIPILRRVLTNFGITLPESSMISLNAEQIKGAIDLQDLSLSQFTVVLSQYSWPAYQGLPMLSGNDLQLSFIDHRLQISSDSDILIQSEYLREEPVKLKFPQPFILDWSIEKSAWQVTRQNFALDNLKLVIDAQIDASKNTDIVLQLKADSMADAKAFIPYPLMGKALQDWLKASLVSGQNIQGELQLKGNLKELKFTAADSSDILKATLTIDNTNLKFQPDWPSIEGFTARLQFTPFDLKISTDQAHILDTSISDVVVNIKELDQPDIAVAIKGKAAGTLTNALAVLQASPLLKKAGIADFMESQLQAEGNVQVSLNNIWIPVHGYPKRQEEVSGEVKLDKNTLHLFDKLHLTELQGQVTFSEKSAESKNLTAKFAGGNLKGSLATDTNHEQLALDLAGLLNIEQLMTDVMDDAQALKGKVPWNLNLSLPLKSSKPVTGSVLMALSDVQSALPLPFDTQFFKENGQNLKSNFTLLEKELRVDAQLTDWGKATALYKTDVMEVKGLIAQFGGQQNADKLAVQPNLFQIKGRLGQVNLESWQNWVKSSEVPSESLPSWVLSHDWRESSLTFQQIQLDEKNHYSDVTLSWQYLNDIKEWLAQLESAESGVYLRRDSLNNYFIQAKGIKYDPVSAKKAADEEKKCQAWSNLAINSFNFNGQNLVLAGKAIDQLAFNYQDEVERILIKDIQFSSASLAGRFEGNYEIDKTQNISQLTFNVTSNDLAKLTRYLEVKQGFSGKKGRVKGSLNWEGSLQCFEVANLNGQLDYSLEDGVIQNAEPGIARLIGLLSIESLARRLKLDINDVTKAGLAFDKISGKAAFDKGTVTLKDFKLLAPSADAELFGQVNLVNKAVKLDARITPAIGSTLPIVAAISGVATPIAGLLTYALMKAIPAINEDLVTYRYEISGDMENPKIKDKGLALELLNGQPNQPKQNILE